MTDKVENEETEIHEFEVNEDEFVIIPPDGNMAYISVWDDVLDDDHCDRLIDLFNQVKHAHTKIEIGDVKNFTELNFSGGCHDHPFQLFRRSRHEWPHPRPALESR